MRVMYTRCGPLYVCRGRPRTFGSTLCISIKTPGTAIECDALPGGALFRWSHLRPKLHFQETAAAAFAGFIALAGGANGNARRIRRAGIPGQPGLVRGQGDHDGVIAGQYEVDQDNGKQRRPPGI